MRASHGGGNDAPEFALPPPGEKVPGWSKEWGVNRGDRVWINGRPCIVKTYDSDGVWVEWLAEAHVESAHSGRDGAS